MTRRILVTGASGFVGQALTAHLVALEKNEVIAMTRATPANRVLGARYVATGDLTSGTFGAAAFDGADVIVHAAARVHVLNDDKAKSATEFDRVNVAVTLELARCAVAAGVRRFVFLSSIGVNGVQTDIGAAFTEADPPSPHNPYADSKLKAEQGLLHLSEQTGLEVVIVRPPLVYGPGVRANFAALMRAVQRGWPLPLACVRNLRSMVAMDNLVSFIATCIDHPQAANRTFLVSDGQDISSPDLVRGLAQAFGVAAHLLPVPVSTLQFVGKILDRGDVIQRVCGSLRVDMSLARQLLAWQPPISMDEGLRRAVAGKST
jgi:nucleoside-diphosphate-sugar epimerase